MKALLSGFARAIVGAAVGAVSSAIVMEIVTLVLIAGGLASPVQALVTGWEPAVVLGAPVGAVACAGRMSSKSAAVLGGVLFGIIKVVLAVITISGALRVTSVVLPDVLVQALLICLAAAGGAATGLCSVRAWAWGQQRGWLPCSLA